MTPVPTGQFWMVVGLDSGPPAVRHDSIESAHREARRLARSNPGNVFVVLEAIEAIIKNDVIVRRYRPRSLADGALDEDIPF